MYFNELRVMGMVVQLRDSIATTAFIQKVINAMNNQVM